MSGRSILARAVAVSVLAAGCLAGAAQAADERLKEILDRGVLRVGVQGAQKPWSFRAPDGSMQGIEVDLGKEVADKLGVKFEAVIITSANRMQFLQQNKIDLILGGMYDTAERRKIVGIIEPAYWTSGPSLLAKKGTIKDWKDVTAKPVCAKQGVTYNRIVESRYKSTIVAFPGNTEGKEALRTGKCVAWLFDDVSIMADLEDPEWKDYEMPVPVLLSNPWAAAVPIEELNKGWGSLVTGMAYRWQASGRLLELAKKWKVQAAPWFQEQHERARWDDSYLSPRN